MWGVQLHPEVDETIVGAWVTDDERTELADRGLDADGILADIEAARAELDEAWRPFAEAFARLVHQRSRPMSRPVTGQGNLTRLGFHDPAAAERHLAALGDAAEPLRRPARPHRRPRRRPRPAGPADRGGAGRAGAAARRWPTTRAPRCGCSACWAPARRWPTTCCRHPEHWRELTDPTLGSTRPAAYAVRERLLEAVGADPHDAAPVATLPDAEAVDALRVEYRRVLLRLAARDLAHDLGVDDAAAELSDLAAGTLEAALAVARAAGGRDGGDRPAGRDRDGQVRRARAQLRLRRRRHLRVRAGRRGRRGRRRQGRRPSWPAT